MTEDNNRLSSMYEMMCKVKKPEEVTPHVTKGNFDVSFTKHDRIKEEELRNNAAKGGWKPTSNGSTVHFNPDNTLRYRDPKPVSTNATTLKRL
jgi:hypothetical protein